MIASRIGSIRRKLIASTIAATVAGIALLFALPIFHKQLQFKSSAVFAGALKETILNSPISLSDALILEPGTIIQSQFDIDIDKEGESQNRQQKSQKRIILKNATLTILQAPATRGRTPRRGANPASAKQIITRLRGLEFRALQLNNTIVQLKRPGGRLQRIGHITAVIRTDKDQKALNAEGQFVRNGTTLTFKAQTSPNQSDSAAKALQLKITGENLQLSLNGKLMTKGGVRVTSEEASFTTADLKKVLHWLGMGTLKSQGFSKLSATGRLTWSGSTIAFDQSKFSIDDNPAIGRLSFYFDPREPSIEGTLAFQKLELTPYLDASLQPTAMTALTKAWSAIHTTVSSGSLPLGLKNIDADIRVSAKSLQYGATEIGRGAAVILVKDGKLKADIAEISLISGARGRSQIEIDTTRFLPRYVLHGNINNFDLGTVSTHWFGKPFIDGIANMTFDLAAHGRTKKELLSSLSGPIVVSAQKGASIPIDLVKLFTKTKKSPNDGWGHIENGFTALKDLSVEIISSNGSLKTTSVKANMNGNSLIATGTLKLKDLVLDLILTRLVVTGDRTSPNSNTSKNATVAKPVQDTLEFKGPITEPIIRFVPQSRKG